MIMVKQAQDILPWGSGMMPVVFKGDVREDGAEGWLS